MVWEFGTMHLTHDTRHGGPDGPDRAFWFAMAVTGIMLLAWVLACTCLRGLE
jgi:hypothetical protein